MIAKKFSNVNYSVLKTPKTSFNLTFYIEKTDITNLKNFIWKYNNMANCANFFLSELDEKMHIPCESRKCWDETLQWF